MEQARVIDVDLLYDRLGQTVSNSNPMYDVFVSVIRSCTVYEVDCQNLIEVNGYEERIR